MTTCVCGIPRKAAFHLAVTLGRDVPGGTETSDADIYLCRRHGEGIENRADVRATFRFDNSESWEILEWELSDTGR